MVTACILQGLLRAGEHVDILFIAEVHDACARQLNLENASLEVTLILHTALGKDHFLTVTGHYGVCQARSVKPAFSQYIAQHGPALRLALHALYGCLALLERLMNQNFSLNAKPRARHEKLCGS